MKSLHSCLLSDKCLDHMLVKFEQNCVTRNIKKMSFLAENRVYLSYFQQNFDAILEDVSAAETIVGCKTINLKITIFQRSKYYACTTLLTRFKVASNMADRNNIIHSDSTLKIQIDFSPQC